jgi:hypothetical protein
MIEVDYGARPQRVLLSRQRPPGYCVIESEVLFRPALGLRRMVPVHPGDGMVRLKINSFDAVRRV